MRLARSGLAARQANLAPLRQALMCCRQEVARELEEGKDGRGPTASEPAHRSGGWLNGAVAVGVWARTACVWLQPNNCC